MFQFLIWRQWQRRSGGSGGSWRASLEDKSGIERRPRAASGDLAPEQNAIEIGCRPEPVCREMQSRRRRCRLDQIRRDDDHEFGLAPLEVIGLEQWPKQRQYVGGGVAVGVLQQPGDREALPA